MARQGGTGEGCLVLLFVAAILLVPVSARGDDRGPLVAFRQAIRIHGNLLCGQQPGQGVLVRYVVEPRPGQPLAEARDRMVEVLRRRLDDRSVEAPGIFISGAGEIDVWFSGSPLQIEASLGILERPGVLEFHAVETTSPWFDALEPALERWAATRADATITVQRGYDDVEIWGETREELAAFAATLPELPPQRILGFQEEEHWDKGPEVATRWRLFLLNEDAPVHGGQIASVETVTDEYDNMPRISLQFNEAGALAFADLSEALVQRYLAIVLDGQVMSAPKVMERIDGGRAHITLGSGSSFNELWEEARALTVVLGSGGHPAGLRRVFKEIDSFPRPPGGWRALGPLPFTAQALALIYVFRYGCF